MSITQQFPKNKHMIEKQNRVKKLAKIPSYLLTHELTAALKLKEQSFIILIPQKLIQKLGYNGDEINFDLVKYENKIHLIQSDGVLN
ncbi:MAG: hypothetical protein IIA82_04545 [Thaumarchaeota archaeon]|nr:hypothetical protein [Nitrososphaerota archaeon]